MTLHEKNRRRSLRRWMLIAAAAATLFAGVASAMLRECSDCTPCACAPNGGYILCCDSYAC